MAWTIKANVYTRAGDAVDAINRIADELRNHDWVVINADVQPGARSIANGYGALAEQQPAQFILSRGGSTQADAEEDVKAAIEGDGDYSIVKKVTTSAVSIVDSAAKGAQGIAANPGKAMSTVELVAIAVIVVAGLVGTVFVVRQVRSVTG